uniref:NAD(P)-binding domain-containing protein n=1 Tax=Panagrolaimus sp. JU765 TaxID=591449 RepID=A0AC34QPP3_9BILA
VAVKKQKFTVQGSGKQLRSWLFVDDASDGVRLAAEKGIVGEVYNLGTYYEKNVLDLAHSIQAEVDRQLGREPLPVEFVSIPDRPYNDMRYLIDISKAKQQLGWEPQISFEDGLQKVVESALKPHLAQKMSVAIFGGRGWIGQQVQKLLGHRNIPFKLANTKVGINTTKELGLHYTYVGTGYLFAYDKAHPIGGPGFEDNDLPTFFGNSYSVVKGFADRMVNSLPFLERINARITLPLNFEMNEDRNLLSKIVHYNQIFDIPVVDELNQLCVTHVLCCTGRTHGNGIKTIEYLEGGSDKAFENVRDNLYCPLVLAHLSEQLGLHYTYVGTGYLFAYDKAHPIGGPSFEDNDLPTFFGNSYSVVKGFADRMVNSLPFLERINARITLPLNFEMNEDRNLLSKIVHYNQIFDIPVSITVIDDTFPVLFDLMEKRFGGPLNLVNPEPISLHGILQLYKQIVDPSLHDYEVVGADSEKGRQLLATKGNCALATDKLVKLCPQIRTSSDALRLGFAKLAAVSH